jgi:hypothetical protein
MTDLFKSGRDARIQMQAAENAAHKPKGIRESLYGHIKVSVRTMDIIICIITILLIASIVIGITQG